MRLWLTAPMVVVAAVPAEISGEPELTNVGVLVLAVDADAAVACAAGLPAPPIGERSVGR